MIMKAVLRPGSYNEERAMLLEGPFAGATLLCVWESTSLWF